MASRYEYPVYIISKGRAIGYEGTAYETTPEKIILQNKKVIKAGTLVKTMIYPLNGKQV